MSRKMIPGFGKSGIVRTFEASCSGFTCGSLRERGGGRGGSLQPSSLCSEQPHNLHGETPDPLWARWGGGAEAPLLKGELAAWTIREDAFGNPTGEVRKSNHKAALIPQDGRKPCIARVSTELRHLKEALRGFWCLTETIAHLIGNCTNGGGTLRCTETSIEIESLPFVFHVTARQVRGDRKIQDCSAAFANRRATFALCTLRLNRFGKQL